MMPMRTYRAGQGGFTLIELTVVIVILEIQAATALPKFADLRGDARAATLKAAANASRCFMEGAATYNCS